MSKLFLLPALLFSSLLAGVAVAEGDIPPEIIAECNAVGDASSLPYCLKAGAVAFDMLAMAREDRFYGEAAAPVIADCGESNDSFKTTWICFSRAAEKAAETRSLIGLENITDACVSAISAPEAYEEIYALYRQKLKTRFPDEFFYGGDSYYAFKGCPEEPEKTSGAGSSVKMNEPVDADASHGITQARCDALDALEAVISSRSTAELLTLQSQISEKDHSDSATLATMLDIDPDAASELLTGTEADTMQMVMLLGAFLREHHPPLYQQVIDNPDQISSSPASDLGGQMALRLVKMMVDGAEETYRSSCGSS